MCLCLIWLRVRIDNRHIIIQLCVGYELREIHNKKYIIFNEKSTRYFRIQAWNNWKFKISQHCGNKFHRIVRRCILFRKLHKLKQSNFNLCLTNQCRNTGNQHHLRMDIFQRASSYCWITKSANVLPFKFNRYNKSGLHVGHWAYGLLTMTGWGCDRAWLRLLL